MNSWRIVFGLYAAVLTMSAAVRAQPLVGDDICVGGGAAGLPCSQHPDCPGGLCHLKNRYISITPSTPPGVVTVIEVVPVALPAPLAGFVGDVWYAGIPAAYFEVPAGATFDGAPLICGGGALVDWSVVGLVHFYGAIIVPNATYEVSHCLAVGGPCGPPLVVQTAKHGDIVPPLGTAAMPAGQPNFFDISSVVAKFAGDPGAPSKTRCQLQPNVPNPINSVNFADISAVVGAFRGFPYPYPAAGCP